MKKTNEMMQATDKRNSLDEWDDYIPSEQEIQEALEDARIMNYNMRTYGTIDVPKTVEAKQ